MELLKPVKSGKVKVDDVNLYYELYGQGDPLVLVAGTGISCAPWRVAQVPEFAKHYQVVIYDHRGLGRSDKPDMPYSTELFAKDCAGLMNALGMPRAHMLGHSMGARVLQWFALKYPEKVRSLVLSGPGSGKYDDNLDYPRGVPMDAARVSALVSRKGIKLQQGWGMTETGPLGLLLSGEMALAKVGSSGLPPLYVRLKICDPDGNEVTRGETGELMIRGPTVTPGYWNRPEANRTAFTSDGWFHTGDAARQDSDGYYYVVDRWKDMFISGGENVYPVEVENAIYQLDGVLENAVVGVPHEKWGEVGRAFVVLKAGANLDEAAVIEHCGGQLARYKVPKEVRFIDGLPHNATGKVLKHQLPRI
jgi:acyl-CoA synthetase (AMP-forming)/AMP-acid ligase II